MATVNRYRVLSIQWIDVEVDDEQTARDIAGEFYGALDEFERELLPSRVLVLDLDSEVGDEQPLLEVARGEFRPVNLDLFEEVEPF